MNLTKDADKMICRIYKSFLQKRKNGISKTSACKFEADYLSTNADFSAWAKADLKETLLELKRAGLVKNYVCGNFDLTNAGIIYMESRFKNGLIEVTDFIAKFLP